jgi:hypothetical protein
MCTVTCGISLATCSSVAWAQATPGHRLQLEATACKLISFIPEPGPGAWEAVAVQKSTLAALAKTGNKSLESVVRAYDEAALAENNKAMIRALDNGVKACHHLGLQTATQHQ